VVVSGEYIWKYTHNAFDFSVLGNTPITFPIDWHNSKIPGYALNVNVPEFHNFSAYSVMSSVAARFFPPQVAGAGATVARPGYPSHRPRRKIQPDHAHSVHAGEGGKFVTGYGRIQLALRLGPGGGLDALLRHNRPKHSVRNQFDTLNSSPAIAMVDTNIPPTTNPVTGASVALPLTADEEFQAGFVCNGEKATRRGRCLPCARLGVHSSLINIRLPEPAITITTRSALRHVTCSMRRLAKTISSTRALQGES